MPTITGTPSDDTLTGTDSPDMISGLGGNDTIYGMGGNDIIDGGDGNDLIDGGTGIDTMSGGTGNDTFFVDVIGDVVIENDSEGLDTIYTNVGYTLPANVERLGVNGFTTGFDINLTGNGLDNEIWGNNGKNVLDGGPGADILRGFGGDDIYFVDNVGDVVVDSSGFDLIYTSVNYTLPTGVERLFVNDTTTTFALNLAGNSLNNEITGNDGANIIDGGTGFDTMTGNGGDDIYFVDNTLDKVVEHVNGGNDLVYTSILNYHLTDNVEREAADPTTTASINLFGNGLDNELFGNGGSNFLDGSTGADIMRGNGGDDSYRVDNVGDLVIESAGGGFDTVFTTSNYTLPDYVEQLKADNDTEVTPISLTGNGLDNVIWANNGNDILDGGAGADTLHGLSGNDVYIVDNVGDVVVESSVGGSGFDLIWTSVDYTASDNVERMGVNGFTTTYAINLTGNGLDNELWGNDGANVLDGGLGADILHGNGGADSFAFTTALGNGNVDSILDFAPGTDKVALDDAVYSGLPTGALDPNAFFVGTAAHDADDRIIYDSTTGALYFDADGTGASPATQFATLSSHPSITAADFIVS